MTNRYSRDEFSASEAEQLFVSGNYNDAFSKIQDLASSGNARCCFLMSRYYSEGLNVVEINDDTKNVWLMSAYQSYKDSGKSIDDYLKDNQNAIALFAWSISSGEEKKEESPIIKERTAHLVIKLAKTGDLLAQSLVYLIFFIYGLSVDLNPEKVKEYLEESASKGIIDSAFYLSRLYFRNSKFTDKEKGLLWLQTAADKGHADAQFDMGCYYYHGTITGFPSDNDAIEWYNKAARQGHTKARLYLNDICK